MTTFYLGVPEASWLPEMTVPVMISRRRLQRLRRPIPRAGGPVVIDSAAYTELHEHGRWTVSAREYGAKVAQWSSEIGAMAWAATQDYMCEPWILERTGLTVREHQIRTCASYLELSALYPAVHWLPVLQGYALSDYSSHVELYSALGVDLSALPLVGLGSVCRRQRTSDIVTLIHQLAGLGLTRLHGFGVKTEGLAQLGGLLDSADSMAWSLNARKNPPCLPGHTHLSGASCRDWALAWRDRMLATIRPRAAQLSLFA